MCALDIPINLFNDFRVLETSSIVVTFNVINCQIIGGIDFRVGSDNCDTKYPV